MLPTFFLTSGIGYIFTPSLVLINIKKITQICVTYYAQNFVLWPIKMLDFCPVLNSVLMRNFVSIGFSLGSTSSLKILRTFSINIDFYAGSNPTPMKMFLADLRSKNGNSELKVTLVAIFSQLSKSPFSKNSVLYKYFVTTGFYSDPTPTFLYPPP